MSWTTALTDLRLALSDNVDDKLRWSKKCLGFPNGVNKTFKTFEKRRLTDFTNAAAPLGVLLDEVLVAVGTDDPTTGVFTLDDGVTAPAEGVSVTGNYYIQWFTDAQLTSFLKMSSFFLGLGQDFSMIPDTLQPAAIKYACADAYQELAVRFAEMVSETFRAEDEPKDALKNTVDSYTKLSAQYRKEANDLRKGYYTRQNQPDAPESASICGDARNVEPNS